jgi:AraC family transcriptional activator of pobA
MAKTSKIPVHKIRNHDLGFELMSVVSIIAGTAIYDIEHGPLVTHRDDYYIFALQENGISEFILDFESVRLEGPHIFFMCPGQVHRYLKVEATGWMLGIETALIPQHLRVIFDAAKHQKQFSYLHDCKMHTACLQLIKEQMDNKADRLIKKGILHSLLEAFIGMTAQSILHAVQPANKPLNRKQEITHQFRKLVQQKFVSLKTPGEYAALLNISVAYLNEVLQDTTGFSTTYLIREEIFLEARRLLYHTQLNAQGIAFRLGYEDPTYFSRLFRKHTGQSPLAFRSQQLSKEE